MEREIEGPLPPGVHALVAQLLGASPCSVDELLAVHPALVEQLRAAALPPGPQEPYGRRVLGRSDRGEVVLLLWRDGHRCAPHDHGDAVAEVHLIAGRFRERRYRFAGEELAALGEKVHDAPQTLHEDHGIIHDVVASGGGLALHVYRPSGAGMRVYDLARRERLTLDERCGAWIPEDGTLIRTHEPFGRTAQGA